MVTGTKTYRWSIQLFSFLCIILSNYPEQKIDLFQIRTWPTHKFLSFKCNFSCNLSYEEKCQYFQLQTLESRREMLDLRMLNKVLCNKVDCPDLLNRIGFRVPNRRTRRKDLFVSNHRLRVSLNSPISRSTNLANDVCLDVFSPVTEFRRNSASYFQF